MIPLFASTAQQGPVTSGPPVFGVQIRRAARTPCNKWAGALPPRRARSPGALAGLRLPATQPQRPKNRLGVAASAGAGGRGAGPGPPASPPRSCPLQEFLPAGGGGRRLATPPRSGARNPRPRGAGSPPPRSRPQLLRLPARPSRCAQEEGQGDGSRNGGFGGGPRRCLADPLGCVRGVQTAARDPGAAGQRLTQEATRPAAASLQLCGGPRPAGSSPGAERRAWGEKRGGGATRGRAGRRVRRPGAAAAAAAVGGAAHTCHGAAGGAGGCRSRSRRLVARRSRALGASAAGEEARRERSVRPERSYSGRHVAAHAPRARRHPPREAAPGLRDPGPHSALAPLRLGSRSISADPLVLLLLARGTYLDRGTPCTPEPGVWRGTLGQSVASLGQTPKEAKG